MMKPDEPLSFLEQYGRTRVDSIWVTVPEFILAGLPTALYLGQSLTAGESVRLGLVLVGIFGVTALIRLGCRWPLLPTFLATMLALIPVVIWAYQALGFGSAPEPWPAGGDY